jgi:hypothetical protein
LGDFWQDKDEDNGDDFGEYFESKEEQDTEDNGGKIIRFFIRKVVNSWNRSCVHLFLG